MADRTRRPIYDIKKNAKGGIDTLNTKYIFRKPNVSLHDHNIQNLHRSTAITNILISLCVIK